MALTGFRSAEDKASRLMKIEGRLVTVVRVQPQRYDVFKDGKKLGSVFKLRSRWDWDGDGVHRVWRDMHSSRVLAMQELVRKAAASDKFFAQQAG